MYNKISSIENESKQNNRTRPIYIIVFIVNLVFLSIAYAYLAISIDKKVNGPQGVSPAHEDETTTTTTTTVQPPIVRPTQPIPNPDPDIVTTTTTTTKKTTTEPDPTPIEQPNWRIVFDNVQLNSGSVASSSVPTIDSYKTSITYETQLSVPGEFYSFDADIVNKGSINAKIYSILEQGLTDEQKRYLEYKVTYKDGSQIKKDDSLMAGERKTITVYLKFKDENITKEDLPSSDDTIKLKYQIVYVEK